jgi:hypothetical protein
MKIYTTLFFLFVALQSFLGQIVVNPWPISPPHLRPERRVIASAGREAKNNSTVFSNSYFMTYTIGETVIYGGTASTNRISNGFIQPAGITPTSPPSPPSPSGLIQADQAFTIYPNPTSDAFIVEAPEEQTDPVRVQLIDANGKLLKEEQISTLKHRMELPEGSAPGTYFVNFYRLDGTFLQQSKLVKMNAAHSNQAY